VPDSLSCAAKLAGKKLKGSGAGGCSWLIPKKTHGKKLVVTVNLEYQGQTETFSQTFKVT
jgi:mevalonate kinase